MDVIEQMPRLRAAQLFWQGFTVAEISRMLGEKYVTVDSWKRRDEWDKAAVHQRVGANIDARLCRLIAKDEKSERDLKEIETLTRQLERVARIKRFEAGGNEADLNPAVKNRNKGKKKKKHKNHLDEDAIAKMQSAWDEQLFGYQRKWWDERTRQRVRNILKSRQIGATWYFAREGFMDALESGDNQVFLSASRNQAEVFRQYIIQFVREETGVELKGNPIELENGATLYFLSTNSRTAQSYHGHLYIDEYFWIPRFQELRKVASGMAAHKKWRQTYFSTPSTLNHEAYPFWSGKHFNKGRPKDQHITVDISHASLKDGRLCEDGQWRQMVTVEDAVKSGCDLFDVAQLKREQSPADFANLYMCQFVDDAASVFSLAELQRCMVDAWDAWPDFSPVRRRPFGERPVWIGYDPSRTRDDASVCVVAPPLVKGGKFRVLEKLRWNNLDFDTQAAEIKRLTERYNVVHIAIDTSGIGYGVYELVAKFFPSAAKINYSVEVKNRLVLKAKQLVQHRRLEFDAGWTDLAHAFMSIHRTVTASGKQTTFQASRTEESGHADLAWSLMHALDKEAILPLEETGQGGGSIMELF